MSDEVIQKKKKVLSAKEISKDVDAFDRVYQKYVTNISDGESDKKLKCRRVAFEIDNNLCMLDTFDKPIEVEMYELNSATELQAHRGSQDDLSIQAMAHVLAKKAIRSVNGHVLLPQEVDMFWEMLSMGGRLVCQTIYLEHCTGIDPELIKKSIASVTIK